jgi:tetratricopeptide (TPR) repeat protein
MRTQPDAVTVESGRGDAWDTRLSPRNPLGIIALFVFLIEAIATLSLNVVAGTAYVGVLAWFVVLYPTFISSAFFYVLWKKREAFYGPHDFRSDAMFGELLRRVEVLDAKQAAAVLDSSTNTDEVVQSLQRLLELGDVRAAIEVGRAFIKQAEYERALQVLTYLNERVPASHPLYYKIRANRSYAYIGLERYAAAIADLEKVRLLERGDHFLAWHAVALAFAWLKAGEPNKSAEAMALARELDGFYGNEKLFSKLYPELRPTLLVAQSKAA